MSKQLTKAEAVKELIDIMERTKPKDRYGSLILVAAIYDPNPDDDGDGEPLPLPKRPLRKVGS